MSTTTKTLERIKLKRPSAWTVVFHNDDVTPIHFVIFVMLEIFDLEMSEAEALTMKVHHEGKANVGLFTKEIAITKVSDVQALAAQNNYPLMTSAEEG